MRGGGTPDVDVVRVQVVVLDARVDVICCIVASLFAVIWTVEAVAVTVADVDMVVVLVFGGATSPFSSFLINSFARDDVELRLLNFLMFLGKNKGLRIPELCKEKKKKKLQLIWLVRRIV